MAGADVRQLLDDDIRELARHLRVVAIRRAPGLWRAARMARSEDGVPGRGLPAQGLVQRTGDCNAPAARNRPGRIRSRDADMRPRVLPRAEFRGRNGTGSAVAADPVRHPRTGTAGFPYWVASQAAMAAISSSFTMAMMGFMAAVWPLARAPLLMSFICAARYCSFWPAILG